MNAPANKKVLIGYGAALLLLIFLGAASYRSSSGLMGDSKRTADALNVLLKLEWLSSKINDIETEQRSYLMTGEARDLEAYRTALADLNGLIRNLRQMSADDPDQQRRLNTLEDSIQTEIDVLNEQIILRREKGSAAAWNPDFISKAKNARLVIREVINEMRQAQHAFLARQSDRADSESRRAVLLTAAGGLLAVLLAGVSIGVLHRARIRKKQVEEDATDARVVLENAVTGIFRLDSNGRYVFVNNAYARMVGHEPNEIVGKDWPSTVHPEDRKKVMDAYKRSLTEGSVEVEARMLMKNGSIFQGAMTLMALHDPGRRLRGHDGSVMDTTRQKQIEEALHDSEEQARLVEERTRLIIDTAYTAFIAMDADGRITDWNPQAAAAFGWSRIEVLSRPLVETIIPPQHREAHRQGLKHFLLTGYGPFLNKRIETTGLHRDGHEFPVELTVSPMRTGETYTFNAFVQDITERKQGEERLRHLGLHDPLTGLPNRNLLIDRLNQAMARARWHKRLIAVLFLDLDEFKAINDRLGHTIGDGLLKQVAERLSGCVREGDTVARLGGDEFVVILMDLARVEDVIGIAQKILGSLSNPLGVDGHELAITTSIGITLYPNDGGFPETLLKKADTAMYRAKKQGRNNYQFYSPGYG